MALTPADHYVVSGSGIDAVVDTGTPPAGPVASLSVDDQEVSDPSVTTTQHGIVVDGTVVAVPDSHSLEVRLTLPEVNLAEGDATVTGFVALTTALTSIGGPGLVAGARHLYEVRPVAATASSLAAGTPTAFVRREAWDLESAGPFDPITLAYARAVQVMQARPASDPTSWTYQGAIHGTVTPPPPGANWNECQHRNWFFLPWHRMYLYFFERIVRKAVLDAGGPADFALPYWNYDRPFPGNSLPPAFRTPTLPDGTANPLFVPPPGRDATLMAGGQVPATATTSTLALSLTNFSATVGLPSFGGGSVGPAHFGNALGALESTPHNVMHPTIGGFVFAAASCEGALMTDPDCAALDPVFWLHHANVDRLWNNWLESGGARANPTESAWLGQSFVFHDETGAEVTLSGADVVDSATQLGYVYDDAAGPSRRMVAVSATSPPEGPPELVAASERTLELTGSTASARMTVPSSTRRLVEAAGEQGHVLVNVEDIEAERDPGLGYAVYLEVPGGPPDGARQHIGNISFFGIAAMNDPDRAHEGEAGFGQSFEATEAVHALREQGLWDPAAVRVTFEPIRVLPPPGEEPSEEARAAAAVALPAVRIGRISLFVA